MLKHKLREEGVNNSTVDLESLGLAVAKATDVGGTPVGNDGFAEDHGTTTRPSLMLMWHRIPPPDGQRREMSEFDALLWRSNDIRWSRPQWSWLRSSTPHPIGIDSVRTTNTGLGSFAVFVSG